MRSTVPCSPRFSGLTAAYSANLMLDEPPLMVRMDCIDSLGNARCVVRVWLFMEFIFPNLTLRFKPVLVCLAIATALLLVEFIGSLGNLRCKIERLLDRKSTRLKSSHLGISYAVFCLEKK